MGIFSSVASIFGAGKKKKAAKQAAAIQSQAAQSGIDTVSAQNEKIQEALAPFITGGQQAFGQQGNLLGLGGAGVQQEAIDALKASPFYQSLFGNGRDTILANGSATGGLRGGNIQTSLANFGRDTLAQTIQQQLANLGGLSSTGLSAAGTSGALGSSAADAIAQLFGNKGAAQAGGVLGAALADQQKYAGIGKLFDYGADLLFPAMAGGGAGATGAGGGGSSGGSGGGIANTLAQFAQAFI